MKGWEVVGLSRKKTSIEAESAATYQSLVGEATAVETYRRQLDIADLVVFNAAHIPQDFASSAEARQCIEVNALAPLSVLNCLNRSQQRFVYLSSAQGYMSEDMKSTTSGIIFPVLHAPFYLASKFLGDVYTEHYRLKQGVRTAVLRIGSVYGPGQYRGMISKFIDNIRADRQIVLENRGQHLAELTYVEDVAQAVLAVGERNSEGIFHIGSGRLTSALEAAKIIVAAAGKTEAIIKLNEAKGRPTVGESVGLDVTRMTHELGLTPTAPEIGLKKTFIDWY